MKARAAAAARRALYKVPLPSSRSGALYSAFSYPTKISPESIAVFIASHTKPGDTVLDTFGGSGTTGLATHLCANPTPEVLELADKLAAPVTWGPRTAVIYELSVLGAFVARTMCSPPDVSAFLKSTKELISICEEEIGRVYRAIDDQGQPGFIRHVIWSEVLICGNCQRETPFWDAAVKLTPLSISQEYNCPACGCSAAFSDLERAEEAFLDPLTGRQTTRRKRVLTRVYGTTGARKWSRPPTRDDELVAEDTAAISLPSCVPIVKIPWGDLHRAGYHKGITHAHHFYTPRNLLVLATIWQHIEKAPVEMRDALRLLVLSYNATHATLMTRVVVKSGEKDFVLTGAQSGVLYISGLPVEKNIFEGLRRKAKTIAAAFAIVGKSTSDVRVVCGDSRQLQIPDKSVDYVFTDPPFGDYIPYAEINFLNEVWLGKTTDRQSEIIVSQAQKKSVTDYGLLMAEVFAEIARTLKEDGRATVVFHSAKAEVWSALQQAYRSGGFQVEISGLLDKLQGSFKQVVSGDSVKGDPLLLLSKKADSSPAHQQVVADDLITELLALAAKSRDLKERTPERLFSRFVTHYLEKGLAVPMDAAGFYRITRPLLET
jgi:predicted RNA methylase